jgi:hypothetical protein
MLQTTNYSINRIKIIKGDLSDGKFAKADKDAYLCIKKFGLGCPQSVRSQAEKFGFLFTDIF